MGGGGRMVRVRGVGGRRGRGLVLVVVVMKRMVGGGSGVVR